jgi:hypothetical protein
MPYRLGRLETAIRIPDALFIFLFLRPD